MSSTKEDTEKTVEGGVHEAPPLLVHTPVSVPRKMDSGRWGSIHIARTVPDEAGKRVFQVEPASVLLKKAAMRMYRPAPEAFHPPAKRVLRSLGQTAMQRTWPAKEGIMALRSQPPWFPRLLKTAMTEGVMELPSSSQLPPWYNDPSAIQYPSSMVLSISFQADPPVELM